MTTQAPAPGQTPHEQYAQKRDFKLTHNDVTANFPRLPLTGPQKVVSYKYFIGDVADVAASAAVTEAEDAGIVNADDDYDDRLERAHHEHMPESTYEELTPEQLREKIGDFVYFTGHMGAFLRLIEFQRCDGANLFLNTVQNNLGYPDAEQLYRDAQRTGPTQVPFTGVSAYGSISNDPAEEKISILVSIPFLGKQMPETTYPGSYPESLNVPAYLGIDLPTIQISTPPLSGRFPQRPLDILVHRAWICVFDNTTIATFKSQGAELPVVYPDQVRQGAFHVLAHMISEILESTERPILSDLTNHYPAYEAYLRTLITRLSSSQPTATLDDLDKSYLQQIRNDLNVVSAMKIVIPRQVAVLQEVSNLLVRSINGAIPGRGEAHRGSHFVRNVFRVPVISRMKRQIPFVLPVLEDAVEQRERVLEDLDKMSAEVKASLRFIDELQANEMQNENLKKSSNEEAKNLREEIQWQGEVMSLFVAVTTLFLPLGFFTQLFALEKVVNQENFWVVTFPFTSIFVAAVVYMILTKRYYAENLRSWAKSLIRYPFEYVLWWTFRCRGGEQPQLYELKEKSSRVAEKRSREAEKKIEGSEKKIEGSGECNV